MLDPNGTPERRDDRMAATVEFARASIIPSGLPAAG
jgi:hypothetical protein